MARRMVLSDTGECLYEVATEVLDEGRLVRIQIQVLCRGNRTGLSIDEARALADALVAQAEEVERRCGSRRKDPA